MCYAAPGIIYLLDRMGVTFNRTAEGLLDFRRFGGTLYNRTAFAGATTGQQLLYALDEQVRRYEAAGLVTQVRGLGVPRPGPRRRRALPRHRRRSTCARMKLARVPRRRRDARHRRPRAASSASSTNSIINTGSAAAAAYQRGRRRTPTASSSRSTPPPSPAQDKLRLMCESARGEGGRVWVPRRRATSATRAQIPEAERWYFLEEKYPRYGNLVPRDIATPRDPQRRASTRASASTASMRSTSTSRTSRATMLDRKLGGILEIYEKFVGDDPREVPMKIFPAVHYSMGGLWVDYERTADGSSTGRARGTR